MQDVQELNKDVYQPVYSMQDELDLDALLRQELRAQRRDFLNPMDKARIEYNFLVVWLDRVGEVNLLNLVQLMIRNIFFIRILQLLRNLL